MINTKKIVIVLLSLGCCSMLNAAEPDAPELSADEIMKKSHERYTGDTRSSESTLILIDNKDRRRVRELKIFGMENSEVEKGIIFFMSPSDVKGTAYLTYDWKDESKEDDSWLYLPALQKVKRVSAADESGAFMGSDFSYADINGLDYEDFSYTLAAASDPVDGKDAWVINLLPKNEDVVDKTGYTGLKSWVRKDNFMVVKSIISLKKAKRVKYYVATDIEQVDGIWTAKSLQMVTTRRDKKEHSSVIKVTGLRFNEAIDESMFDTQAMQRGL